MIILRNIADNEGKNNDIAKMRWRKLDYFFIKNNEMENNIKINNIKENKYINNNI